MTIQTLSIPLSNNTSDERLIKRGARLAFSLIRGTASHAQRVPGLLHQAVSDVREAWAESAEHPSLPNA